MTKHELERQLNDLPGRLLHNLAKGRVPRHFRMGKTRLVQSLLNLSPEQRIEIGVEIAAALSAPARPPSASEPKTPLPPAPASQTSRRRPHRDAIQEPAVTKEELFEGIGTPPPAPFTPDAWQREAIDHLTTGDVIVSVPTGSGKTYVAVEATRRAVSRDQTVIYTSPLKALSNTKLTEFAHLFGSENVGILTGERRDNPRAPILIMTTEILRNVLYDAASGEIDLRVDTLGLVIVDESQFLADPERGVVWEETIIFCPAQSRILLLSASIGNPEEVAAWINLIRATPCRLVHHRNRSVPLRAAYLDPSGTLVPFFRTRDIAQGQALTLHPDAARLFARYEAHVLAPRSKR